MTTAGTQAPHGGADAPAAGRHDAFLRGFTLRRGGQLVERYATIIGFVVMFAVFVALKPDVFWSLDIVTSILDQASVIVVLAIGLTVVMVAGEFDLSFPGLIGLSAVVAVKTMSDGTPTGLAVLLAVAVGVAGGVLAGLLVATRRTSSFIITLALNTIWGGLALGISGGGGSTITDVPESFVSIASSRVADVPYTVFYAALVAIVIAVVLRYTVFGRNARAIGVNPTAARQAGIRTGATVVGAFGLMGLCAGIAAVMLSSKTGQYTPALADGLFIPPFVAVFFGISVLALGRFNVFGTVVGALFIGTLETGLIVNGLEAWVGDLVVGATLLAILFVAAQTRTSR